MRGLRPLPGLHPRRSLQAARGGDRRRSGRREARRRARHAPVAVRRGAPARDRRGRQRRRRRPERRALHRLDDARGVRDGPEGPRGASPRAGGRRSRRIRAPDVRADRAPRRAARVRHSRRSAHPARLLAPARNLRGAMRRAVLTLVCLGALAAAPPAAAARLYAGAARADITPPTGYYMMGWVRVDAKVIGQHTRLWARVIVLREGDKKIALVAGDLNAWPGGLLKQAAEMDKDLGYSEQNVVASASHTHAAPTG